jgi:hypothetical protein
MGDLKSNSGQWPTSRPGSAGGTLSGVLFRNLHWHALSWRSSNLTLHAKTPAETCLENRFSPSQLGQEILKLGSRILATLCDFSLFADRTATPQRRRSKRAARCFSNMALWEDSRMFSATSICRSPTNHVTTWLCMQTPALQTAPRSSLC